jgi:stage II sporulation SpoAA-like protein
MARVFVTKNQNLRSLQFGELGASVLGPYQWDDAEWEEYLSSSDDSPYVAIASLAVYVAPLEVNAKQRKRSAERIASTKVKYIAVVTDSAIARGVTTAFGWITQRYAIKAYALRELDDALTWLLECGVKFDRDEVKTQLTAIMAELEPIVRR